MKKLTKGQRFALAREARRLAMECVEGTAPPLSRGRMQGRECCAMARITRRALGTSRYIDDPDHPEDQINEAQWIVIDENDYAESDAERKVGLPWALLALADALEASAASARKRPQKALP